MVCPKKNISTEALVRYVYDFVESHIGDSGYKQTLYFDYTNLSKEQFDSMKRELMGNLAMYRTWKNLVAKVDASLSNSSANVRTLVIRIEIGYGMSEGNIDWYNKVNEIADMAMSKTKDPAGQIAEYMIWLSKNSYYEASVWGAYTSRGIYLDGRGVCAGYASAFKDFCDAVGIPATIVDASKGNHAFNSVYLDGEWYFIDTTGGGLHDWEDQIKANPSYYVKTHTKQTHYKEYYDEQQLRFIQNLVENTYKKSK